jgi:hypothetical protein
MLHRYHRSFHTVYSFPNITTSILCIINSFRVNDDSEMNKYSFPSTQNTMNILVSFSLLTAFNTQRSYKDNRNSCIWSLKSSIKSRVQKRGMFKAKSRDYNITCFSVKTSVSENWNQSTNYSLHDQYYTGHSVYTLHGLLSPTSAFNPT